ncbi:MAG TPA: type II secretion system protein [Phycisphaerae bacterium]|nr:type II secretion system protein [Phycisphaerae bacterium]
MSCTPVQKAFSLVELVIVVAMAGLVVSILAPGLQVIPQKNATAMCLSNLRQIGAASWSYAAEDAREQLVPLHQAMVRTFHGEGFPEPIWAWVTAVPRSFGGRTATVPFPMGGGDCEALQDDNGYWATRTRPLNRWFYPSLAEGLERTPTGPAVFHCPADTGYPDSEWIVDAPGEAVGIPHYDMLGNSYRFNTIGLLWAGSSGSRGGFTSGPWGHTASSIASPLEETVLYSDPMFYNFSMIGENAGGPDPIPGWHGELMSDNVAYCDGSARLTRVGELYEFSDEELDEMNYADPGGGHDWHWFLRRGPTWREDCYPTPGAQIRVYTGGGGCVTPDVSPWLLDFWPWQDYQYNPPPE